MLIVLINYACALHAKALRPAGCQTLALTARRETGRDANKERLHMLRCNHSRLSYFKTPSFFLSATAKYIQQAKERKMQLRKPKGGTEKKTEQHETVCVGGL